MRTITSHDDNLVLQTPYIHALKLHQKGRDGWVVLAVTSRQTYELTPCLPREKALAVRERILREMRMMTPEIQVAALLKSEEAS